MQRRLAFSRGSFARNLLPPNIPPNFATETNLHVDSSCRTISRFPASAVESRPFERSAGELGRATLLSGIIESIAAIAALAVWYSVFVARAGPAIETHFAWPYSGEMGLLSLYMHPMTWMICYFGLEGAVRMLTGLVSDEAPGTLPLALVDRAARIIREGEWRSKPALVRDKVERQGESGELRIASCRAKDHWKYPLTIRYQGEFFQVQGEEHVPTERNRPHVYRLRKLPANEIIRGLEEYDSADVLHEERPPGFFATVAGELRRKWS